MDKQQPKSTEAEADAEDLLKQLNLELELKRGLRNSRAGNRAAFRLLSLLFLLVVIGGALAGLYYYTVNIPPSPPVHQVESP